MHIRSLRFALVLLAVASCSTTEKKDSVNCAVDADCTIGTKTGICQATHFCSYADPTCSSGERYAATAPGSLGSACVMSELGDMLSSDMCTGAPDDSNNCGMCGVVCGNGTVCINSICACPPAMPDTCGQTCVNEMSDVTNCGGCGHACMAQQKCQASACVEDCSTGFSDCGTYCAMLSTVADCGTCGAECGATDSCVAPTFRTMVPTARYSQAAAYDAARGETIMFGGSIGIAELGDTWAWNGTSWTAKSVSGPSPRTDSAMAYDPVHHQIVLFGGAVLTSFMDVPQNDTWLWDGTTWTQATLPTGSTTPPARYFHSMAFDATRGTIVMFGGATAGPSLNDAWSWDGTQWTAINTTGTAPTARYGHSLTDLPSAGGVVVFGGVDGSGNCLNDTYILAGSVWMMSSATAPTRRYSHGAAYDGSGVFIFGGYGTTTSNGSVFSDEWVFDGMSWTQRNTATPTPRYHHTMVYDSARSKVVLMAGVGSSALHDVWEWNGSAWVDADSNGPQAREGATMTYDANADRTMLFGGINTGSLGDTWLWDGNEWLNAATGPAARSYASMAYDQTTHHTVLFGGLVSGSPQSDTWDWNNGAWTAKTGSGPAARSHLATAFDGTSVMLVGGDASGTKLNDTWSWTGTAWTNRNATGPTPARSGHAITFDSTRSKVVLFGGDSGAARLDDTWEWDGTTATWTQITITGTSPPARSGAVLAYDLLHKRTVLYGGTSDGTTQLSDLWWYDGAAATWTQLTAVGAIPRVDGTMVYDVPRSRMLVFGGATNDGMMDIANTDDQSALGTCFPVLQ